MNYIFTAVLLFFCKIRKVQVQNMPNKHKTQSWSATVQRDERVKHIDVLLHFFLSNNGKMLRAYLDGQRKKGDVVKGCLITLRAVGVYNRTTNGIQKKLNQILRIRYIEAYEMFKQGITNHEATTTGCKERDKKLERICPGFFQLKPIIGTVEIKSTRPTKSLRLLMRLQDQNNSMARNISENSSGTYAPSVNIREKVSDKRPRGTITGTIDEYDKKFQDAKLSAMYKKQQCDALVEAMNQMAVLYNWSEEKLLEKTKEVVNDVFND